MEIILDIINVNDFKRGSTVLVLAMVLIVIACLLDLRTGITASKAKHIPINSHGLRSTLRKALEYYTILMFGVMFDVMLSIMNLYKFSYATAIICLICVGIEAYSSFENYKTARCNAAKIADVVDAIIKADNKDDAVKAAIEAMKVATQSKKDEKCS